MTESSLGENVNLQPDGGLSPDKRGEVPSDQEFRAFFLAEYAPTVRRVFLVVGDREAAEDAAQETFLLLLTKWARISRYDQPGAWVRRVAIRLAVRAAKRARARLVPQDEGIARFPHVNDPEPAVDVRRALVELPPAQRAAVVLYYYDRCPVVEIAETLGCSVATVKVHLHRARRRLAKVLDDEEWHEA